MDTLTINGAMVQLQDEQIHQQQRRQLETPQSSGAEEEQQIVVNLGDLTQEMSDNIASIPKEMILISLVSQEQALFNPKHEHYRSTQRKDAKWLEIADQVSWSEAQCKAKWKALRDQYCRELKRAKLNANTNVKWKYFKVLDFLRPYALARHYRSRSINNANVTTAATPMATANALSSTSPYGDGSNNNAATLNNGTKLDSNMLSCSFATAVTTTATPPIASAAGQLKHDSVRLMPTLTAEQINNVIQQQNSNWNYLTTTSANTTTVLTTSRNDQHQGTTIAADDALYNALVDCVAAVTTDQLQQQQQQQPQQTPMQTPDEEDEDPIHTFLNIESYFEKELIALIHQEEILYNNNNQNYRNVKLKLEVWDEIARKLKKSVKQCRQKWKALRDQYIREHKRLKTRDNMESMPRWKHYDALNFLQKFIKQKSNESDAQHLLQLPKTETDGEMDEHIVDTSPLRSPHVHQQLALASMSTLNGQHMQQQQHQNANANQQLEIMESESDGLCVAGNYDEMDIENFINGDTGNEVHDEEEEMEECDDDDDDPQHVELKTKTHYSDYNVNSSSADEPQEFIALKVVTEQSNHTIVSGNINNTKTLQIGHNHNETQAAIDENNLQRQKQQQQLHHQQHHHQQQQQQHQLQHHQQHDEFHQPQTPNSSNSLSVQTTPNSNMPNSTQTVATTLTTVAQPIGISTNDADDEVGAFFRAIAMKIRRANLPPIAFTDLQIDILRVINESLRNH